MTESNKAFLITFRRPIIDNIPQWKCTNRKELSALPSSLVSYDAATKELSVVIHKRVSLGFSKRPHMYL